MEILTSKKFWFTIVGMVCITVLAGMGTISGELYAGLFAALCGFYTIGQGIADAAKKY